MRRRTVIFSLTAAAAGALAGCATGKPHAVVGTVAATTPSPTATATPSATTSAAPIFASTTASSLKPQPVTAYVPQVGTAPLTAYAVGRREVAYARGAQRPLRVTLWYPADGASTGAPVEGAAPSVGRFPVVLFSHGLNSRPRDFAEMLSYWARAGFVIAAPTYPYTSYQADGYDPNDVVNQPADASYVLTQLLALDTGTDPFAGHLDATRVAAAGHSGGGITTAGLFSSRRDDRLKAGIIMAGTDFAGAPFAGPPAAMLFMHGTDDETVAYRAGHTVFEAVPWSRAMLTITGGGHDLGGEAITSTGIEFLRWSLYGDADAKARIPAAAAAGGVATLENQL
jgi:hypothetical protein